MRLSSRTISALAAAVFWALGVSAQSYEVQAGAHVIFAYSGSTIPQSLYDAARAGTMGGIILFGDNVNSNTKSQIDSLQAAYRQSPDYPGVPLLIMTDQEGGQVNRLPGGPSQSAKQIGQSSNPASAAGSAGSTTANVFSNYHVNANLAPVLGVYRSSGDFLDQYQRSYGNTGSLVSTCAGPYISSFQSRGYAATAKHFPGLGAAGRNENTDAEPVTINLSLSELRNVDEAPFSTAIRNGVDMIMPSWAVYPALDSSRPAGLSSKWLRSELRDRLGFRGVTISDSIRAGGLNGYGSNTNRAILAMNAGMDIILATADGSDIVSAIASAIRSGKINQNYFSGSSQRVMDLRSGL